ncbi:MAG TPA: DUF4918 family protein [Lacibacter sp.]|nr:DUF4918 family protein [Lacibacter sp.]HMO88408.1 DUF4918 family protein [Lacibacter sp.]HMP86292.1 DUF4918 family protein [Lacibacter sp.]
MLAHQILSFLFQLPFTVRLPRGVQVLNPYADATAQEVCTQFYERFYSDDSPRTLLLGINPGRYGGGITGIPFTDPVQLERYCGMATPWKRQEELSARFVWEVIAAMGGPELFYNRFYISAISPLGFVKEAKNLNYYDDPLLLKRIEPFAVECLRRQLDFGLHTEVCFCIGEGDNLRFLHQLNQRHGFFQSVVPLPHPRFIMQYKLRQKADFIQLYKERLTAG